MKAKILLSLLFLLGGIKMVSAGGSLEGTVRLKGGAGKPKKLVVMTDRAVCGREVPSEGLVTGKKGELKNAVVFLRGPVEGAKSFAGWKRPFEIDQKGCLFQPRILLVPVGQPVMVKNSDGILHNFHTFSKKNRPLNRAQVGGGAPLQLTFDRSESIRYECDVHSWMKGWIVVADHPYYALTSEEGAVRLEDIPAGNYDLQVWHEALGELEKRVTIREGETTRVDFQYFPK